MRETGKSVVLFEGIRPVGRFDVKQFEMHKTKLCHNVFLDAADEDYVTARYAWRARLANAFCWSAGQAIEKYTKCALLLNGGSANFSHGFSPHFKKLQSICGSLIADYIEKPEDLDLIEGTEEEFPEGTFDAIKRFEENGQSKQRYRESGHYVRPYDIHKLDALCINIRQVCVSLNELREDGLTWKEYLNQNPKTLVDFGRLKKRERRHFPEMNDALRSGNFQFFKEPPGPFPSIWFSWQESAILNLPIDDRNYLEALDWLTRNSKMDKEKVRQFLLEVYNK